MSVFHAVFKNSKTLVVTGERDNYCYHAAWNENSVCLSVCLSNTWFVKKMEKKICPDFYTIRKII